MSKAKLNKKDFIFEKKKGEVLTKIPGQINGLDFLISNLEDCEVYIMDHTAQIFVDDCKNCQIYIGPVEASVFVRECENLKVSAACSQYRVSDSKNIDSCVYSFTDPTLENCKNLRFAPYNFAYPLQDEHFQKANLDPTQNKWSQVFDFNENRENPNWTIMSPEDFPGPVEKAVDDMPAPVNPVPYNVAYGGTLDEPVLVGSQEQGGGSQGMMAFDIKTGAAAAQQQFEAHQAPVEEEQNQYQAYDQTDYADMQNFTQEQQQTNLVTANFDDDDFFNSQSQAQPTASTQFNTSAQPVFDMSQAYGGQGMNAYDPNYDPEEEERLARLRQIEQERNIRLDQKAREEREKKQANISEAARALARWHSDREQNINKQKQINKQNQQIKDETNAEEEYKNSWDKVVSNIATKEGEYPGTKDVTRMRQALINKKADETKGVSQKIAEY